MRSFFGQKIWHWMDGWGDGSAGLRIAYKNKKCFTTFIFIELHHIRGLPPKVGRITRLINDKVCLICYENGLELDLGTSEWPNLLFYSCCIPMFWMH